MEIWVPKYRDILVPIPPVRFGVGGEFRCVLYNENGGIARDTGWFHNLITNSGLGLMTTSNAWHTRFYISSSAGAPVVGETAVPGFLAYSVTGQGADVTSNSGAPNYIISTTKTMRFIAGVGTGTVNSVAIGADNAGTQEVARQIVTPAIVKGASQVLDVSYKFSIWPVLTDLAGVVNVDGADYNTIVRGLDLDQGSAGAYQQMGLTTASGSYTGVSSNNLGTLTATDPGGTTATGIETNTWLTGGVSGTVGYRETDQLFGLNFGNIAGGIRTNWATTLHIIRMQCQWNKVSDSSKIQKDNTKIWTPRWRLEWIRH